LITFNPASKTAEGTWTDADGVKTDYVELFQSDGSANLLSISDNPRSRATPDSESDINFASDGSGVGLVKARDKRGNAHLYRVLFNADGTGTVIDEKGNHYPFGY